MDLISRQAEIDHLRSIIDATDTKDRYNEGFADGLEFCISHVATMPSAQPERKPGKWILSDIQNPEDVRNGNYVYICSNCSHSDTHAKTTVVPFCWHCGADMREEN